MRTDNANRFQSWIFEEGEEQHAIAVSPYFFGFLQNKIAVVANSVVEFEYAGKDLHAAVIEHERLKAQVLILEELMRELQPPAVLSSEPTDIQP